MPLRADIRRQMNSTSSALLNLCADIPSLDPERVAMLRELCLDAGDEVLKGIIECWESEATRQIEVAEAAVRSADTSKAKAAAHAIKGSCGNMGATRLAELGHQLELKAMVPADAVTILAEMHAELARTRSELVKLDDRSASAA